MSFITRKLIKYKRSIKNIVSDYTETFKNFGSYYRKKPVKCSIFSSVLLLISFFTHYCPDADSYSDLITCNTNVICLISPKLRNRAAQREIFYLKQLQDEGRISTFPVGPCRIAYIRRTPLSNRLYSLNCKFLIPSNLKFYNRILDVGFMHKWWYIDRAMIDFDVTNEE